MSDDEKAGIGMPEVKFIASLGKCPNCGSESVRFRIPLESYLETEGKELKKVVLDFSNPKYWLKTTTTHCVECGYEFHLRDNNEDFYKGLQETREREGTSPNKWYYDFESYKTE